MRKDQFNGINDFEPMEEDETIVSQLSVGERTWAPDSKACGVWPTRYSRALRRNVPLRPMPAPTQRCSVICAPGRRWPVR
eukprot:663860-Heterocapsa_arctica.AAC.1